MESSQVRCQGPGVERDLTGSKPRGRLADRPSEPALTALPQEPRATAGRPSTTGRADPGGDDPARRSLRGRRPARRRRPGRAGGRPEPRGWTWHIWTRTPPRSTSCTCTPATRRGRARRAVLGGDGPPARPAARGDGAPAAPAARGGAGTRLDAHLDAVLATAEVVLTLTPGAADEIADAVRTDGDRRRAPVGRPSPIPALGAERGLVGLRLGPASPGVPDAGVAGAGRAVRRGVRRRAVARAGRADDEPVRSAPSSATWPPAASSNWWCTRRSERPAQLQQLHVAVLPEGCGTHSRDLEICRDVGTRVVAPSCGWFADQWSEVRALRDRRGRPPRPALAHRLPWPRR